MRDIPNNNYETDERAQPPPGLLGNCAKNAPRAHVPVQIRVQIHLTHDQLNPMHPAVCGCRKRDLIHMRVLMGSSCFFRLGRHLDVSGGRSRLLGIREYFHHQRS